MNVVPKNPPDEFCTRVSPERKENFPFRLGADSFLPVFCRISLMAGRQGVEQ
jgi:hypothetical protein